MSTRGSTFSQTNTADVPCLLSIRQAAKAGPLSEWLLRQLVREGRCPGIHSGSKFLVNYNRLLEKIDAGQI